MEINFIYQEKDHTVECSEADLIKDVCEKFTKENNLDLNDIYFVYKGEEINFNLGLFVQQIYDLKNNSNEDKKRIDIYINEKPPFYINFFYNAKNKPMKVKLTDKVKDAFKKFAEEDQIDLSKVYFLYDTKQYFYNQIKDERISDIITDLDKKEKVMTVTVLPLENDIISRTPTMKEQKQNPIIIEDEDKDNYIEIEFIYKDLSL